jgi:hypothetical protein
MPEQSLPQDLAEFLASTPSYEGDGSWTGFDSGWSDYDTGTGTDGGAGAGGGGYTPN